MVVDLDDLYERAMVESVVGVKSKIMEVFWFETFLWIAGT